MSKVKITSDRFGTSVNVDGVEIANKINGYEISENAQGKAILSVSYNCYDQLTIDGEYEVVHICPKKAR